MIIMLVMFFKFILISSGRKFSELFFQEDRSKHAAKFEWFYFVYLVFYRFPNTLIEWIYVLLMYEWISMIYIITTQKDRKAEEILFDYNNENMDEAEK